MADHMQSNLAEFANTLQSQLVAWEAFMDRQLKRMHQLQLVIQSEQEDCKENICFAKQQIAGLQSMAGELAASQGIATLEEAPPKQTELAPTQEDEEDEVLPSTEGKLPPDTNVAAEKVMTNKKCKRYFELTTLLHQVFQVYTRAKDKHLLDIRQSKETLSSYNVVVTVLKNADSELTEDDESFKGLLKKHHSQMRSLLFNLDEWLYAWSQSQKSYTDDFNKLQQQRLGLYKIVNWSEDRFKEITVTVFQLAGSQACPQELVGIAENWYTPVSDYSNSLKPPGSILEVLQPGYMLRNANNSYYLLRAVVLKIASQSTGRS